MASKDMAAPGPFAPYVNTINESDPFMKRVPMKKMDIAANDASMPSMGEGPGKIVHVGGSDGR